MPAGVRRTINSCNYLGTIATCYYLTPFETPKPDVSPGASFTQPTLFR